MNDSVDRIYWSIGEVAEQFHVAESLLRHWEGEFSDFLHPHRSMKGNRKFTQQDILVVKVIHYLLKVQEYTTRGARKQLQEKGVEGFINILNGPNRLIGQQTGSETV